VCSEWQGAKDRMYKLFALHYGLHHSNSDIWVHRYPVLVLFPYQFKNLETRIQSNLIFRVILHARETGHLKWGGGSNESFQIERIPPLNGNVCVLKVPVRISARAPSFLAKVIRGFPHFKENSEILPWNRPRPLPSTSLPIRHSVTIV
jgi:hypothetical protein